jgi:hypothetical protein
VKTCNICLFGLGLFHSTWCFTVQSIYYGWVILHSGYIPHFLYPFTECWALRLILQLGYCEQSCDKHGCVNVSFVYWFILLWIYAQECYLLWF